MAHDKEKLKIATLRALTFSSQSVIIRFRDSQIEGMLEGMPKASFGRHLFDTAVFFGATGDEIRDSIFNGFSRGITKGIILYPKI